MGYSTPKDILNVIKNLKNTNSTGHDDISTNIIKAVAEDISPVLSYLVNLSLEYGVFPDMLKISVVKPLFKQEDKQNMEYYRPLVMVSIFSKIYEKIIYKNIYSYLEKYNILVNEQKGFRKNKSTDLAIYDFLRKVTSEMDARTQVSALYMDLSRAFEYVDHKTLFSKLSAYGIRGNTLNLIKSYLSDRLQITKISYINSNCELMTSASMPRNLLNGLPQGSNLGPLLFIVYTNDMPFAIEYPIEMYADDSTAIISKHDNTNYESEINRTLNSIIQWLEQNNLCINLSKTKMMQFSQREGKTKDLHIVNEGTVIEEIDSTKFFGIYIDNRLTWKQHIDYICKRLNTFSYALYKLAKVVKESTALVAFQAYVMSTLRYGIIFWGNSTDRLLAFRAQKKCVRAICKLKLTDSCVPHFKRLKILTFPSIYLYEVAVFVKANMSLFDTFGSDRVGTLIKSKSHVTALYSKSIFGMAPKIFNHLPKTLRNEENINVFKMSLKKIFVEKCYYCLDQFFTDKITID